MRYKVGIIGCFGADKNLCDGQTVKTNNLAMLIEQHIDSCVFKVDTYHFRDNKMQLFFDSLKCMFTCKHVFLLVSVNGMNFYLRFLYLLNKLARRHIYHYIIGSELLEMVEKNSGLVKYLNALDINWFEYESGTCFLQSRGVNNVVTLPNFKMITPVAEILPYEHTSSQYRFCTFSRVMEEKGITEAIETIDRVNELHGKIIATLDIYGPIDSKYADEFHKLLNNTQHCISYKGIADSAGSVEILKNYYALIFPTHWAGEGVPGTLIDAFAAGIPVIASDWNANKEVVDHGKQGILYPNQEAQTLLDAVLWSIRNESTFLQMRSASRKKFEKYMPETILNAILNEMKKRESSDD